MTTRTEKEIKSLTKEQNYLLGYEDGTKDMIDRIKLAREELEELATEQIQVYDEENLYISGVVDFVSLTEVRELLDKLIESEGENGISI